VRRAQDWNHNDWNYLLILLINGGYAIHRGVEVTCTWTGKITQNKFAGATPVKASAPALTWKLTGVPAPLSAVEYAVVSEEFGKSIKAIP